MGKKAPEMASEGNAAETWDCIRIHGFQAPGFCGRGTVPVCFHGMDRGDSGFQRLPYRD